MICLKEKIKKQVSTEMLYAFVGSFLTGFLGHIYVFTHNYVNWDGLYYFYVEDLAMYPSGRWFLGIATAISGKYTMPIVIGILSIFYLSLGNALLVKFFEVRNRQCALLIGSLISLSPVVTGTFTYMFTADGYFLAYLFAVIAAYVLKYSKKTILAILAGGGILCLSLGIYQAYGAVTIIILMLDGIILLLGQEDNKKVFWKIARYVMALLAGFISYFTINNICLKIQNTTLNEYQGLADMNRISVKSILLNIPRQYPSTFEYLRIGELFSYNSIMRFGYIVISILGLCALIQFIMISKKPIRICLAILDFAALPIILNMFCLVSENTVNHLLMKMCWLMPAVFLFSISTKLNFKYSAILKAFLLLSVMVIAFNYWQIANIVYVNIEQRQQRTYTLASRILNRMENLDGYYEGIPVFVPGMVWEEGGLLPGELYNVPGAKGKYYVRTGVQLTFVFRDYLGVPFNYQYDVDVQDSIINNEEYIEMPVWPDRECMKIIDGVLVIRFPDKQ